MENVARFPVEKVMPTRIAEERIGGTRSYCYPAQDREVGDPEEWLKRLFTRRFVLLGWEPIKEGVVKSFKDARVRHLVVGVKTSVVFTNERPIVELACKIESYPVWNWKCYDNVTRIPVLLLSPEQVPYFQLCKRCEMRLRKMIKG